MPRHARRQHKHWTARLRERGSVSLETAVVMPAILTLMFLGMQGALLYQGRTTALAAAQEGARVAAGENSSTSAGIAAAQSFAGSSTMALEEAQVSGNRTAAEATITVSIRTASVIPGWNPTVTQTASMPVERITG